ncbi:hypothetical protein AB9P05_19505 [Roseivirga sp. BDSF3-8]|uniref:hypothetical protein n=1 Tax=Roseivirga sp. BDSF3-8 TaxID=3241598 RepID=UPI0035322F0A
MISREAFAELQSLEERELAAALKAALNGRNGELPFLSQLHEQALSTVSRWDEAVYLKLEDDLASNPAFAEKFFDLANTDPAVVEAWKAVGNAAKRANPDIADAGKIIRKDIKSLEAFAKFDIDLIDKIGQERFNDFITSLIKANPKCKTCGNSGSSLVGDLDDVLNDLYEVTTKRVDFGDADLAKSFDDFLKEAGEQASKAKGASLTLKKMSRNWDELTEGGWSLKGFEGSIPDVETGHRLDLKFGRTIDGAPEVKSIEMKNWKEARSISGDTYKQFKAYISSGKQFDYYFTDGLSDAMKGNFENIFKDASKANELWKANPEFFRSLDRVNINTVDDIIDLADAGELVDLINWIK